jgi:hypothetical protein
MRYSGYSGCGVAAAASNCDTMFVDAYFIRLLIVPVL